MRAGRSCRLRALSRRSDGATTKGSRLASVSRRPAHPPDAAIQQSQVKAKITDPTRTEGAVRSTHCWAATTRETGTATRSP